MERSASESPAVGSLAPLRALLLVVGLVIITVHLWSPNQAVEDWSILVAGFIGWTVAAWGAWHQPVRRAPFTWIAVGLGLTWAGDVTFQVQAWAGHDPSQLSWAEIPWLVTFAAMGAALVGLARAQVGSPVRIDPDALVDMGIASVVGAVVVWEVYLRDMLTDDTLPAATRLVWAAYPILDCVLLVLLVRLVMERRGRVATNAWFAAGIVCWLVADFGYMLSDGGDSSRSLNAGWIAGVVLLAAGTLTVVRAVDPADPPGVPRQPIDRTRLVVAMVPLIVPGGFVLVNRLQGTEADPIPLLVATSALVVLATVRGLRLLASLQDAVGRTDTGERHFRALALNSSDAVLVLDDSGASVLEHHNIAGLDGALRVPMADVEHLHITEVLVPLDPDEAAAIFDKSLLAPGQVVAGTFQVRHCDGSARWLAARVVNLLGNPDVAGVVVNLHDVTARKQAELDLTHQAFHDPLTGLANRALLRDRIEHTLSRAGRTGHPPSVVYLDLDGFKTINDSLGHEAGDRLLVEVAERLRSAVREGDTVSRLGGDEFAVLIDGSPGREDAAEATADRLQQALSLPVELGEHLMAVSASMGIAVADARSTASSLLRHADVAMYQSKQRGESGWVRYRPEMGAASTERLELEMELVSALTKDQFEVVYQPVIDLRTEKLVGFEALLRWNHPRLGVVMPDRFIPITEDKGLIVPIGRWVLDTACRQAARWQRSVPSEHPLTVAVNISARQLAADDLVDHVRGALAASGLPPSSLVLELTETSLVQDAGAVAARLRQLRALGIRLAIDDFGTGYSSLSYLRQFPIDILKIDRSFVETINDDAVLPAIVRGLLELGRTLDLEIIAEGVERRSQRDALRDDQCAFGQGFLFDRPLSVSEVDERLLDPNWTTSSQLARPTVG